MQSAAERMAPRLALLLCLVFFALGCVFLPYTGAQYDEVLFASQIYPPYIGEFSLDTPFGKLPLMVMTYVGSLKTWLMWPLLKFLGPSHAVMRLPMLAAATVSIFLFFLTMRRLVNPWIAVLTTALLATDLNYLLLSLYDWGPVALQHLLLSLALYGGVRFAQAGQRRWLVMASFAAGLALWDKAIFIWVLGGFGAALLLVFPGPVLRLAARPRLVAPAAAAFLLGCAPLLYYNWVKPLKTFTADVEIGKEDYYMKISQVDSALAGDGMRGFLSRPEAGTKPADLKLWERAALKLEWILRFPRRSFQAVLVVLSLLAVPILLLGQYRRLVLWLVLGLVLSCAMMFSTHRAGGGMHHSILLWPMFHWIVAIAAAELYRWRPRITAALLLAGAASNLIVADAMIANFARCGSMPAWSDAVRGLVRVAGNDRNRIIAATEWGIVEQIRYFSEGRIGYYPGSDGWLRELNSPAALAAARRAIELETTLWIGHAEGSEIFPDTNEVLGRLAADMGYQKRLLQTVRDRHGRAVFELFDFRKP